MLRIDAVAGELLPLHTDRLRMERSTSGLYTRFTMRTSQASFFCVFLGLGFSILSGGLTLGCMVLPILIREAQFQGRLSNA